MNKHWYRVSTWGWGIASHPVQSFTAKTVTYGSEINKRRENIVSDGHRWFKTEEEAKQWCREEIESKIERMNGEIKELADRLEELQ